MKRGKLFLLIILAVVVGCRAEKEPELSIEACYRMNLSDSTLLTGWYYVSDSCGFVRQLDKSDEYYTINPYPVVTFEDIVGMDIERNREGYLYLSMRFGERGRKSWEIATSKAINRQMAFVVDNKLLYTPFVHAQITGGISAFGRVEYSKEELEKILLSIGQYGKK
jgi:hypothetical protein